MRRPLVAGNWKLHGSCARTTELVAASVRAADELDAVEWLVCPPFVYLQQAVEQARGSRLDVGGQDVSARVSGAFTGEVAGSMLADVGCGYVIVGHSERRAGHGEDDATVAAKCAAAVAAGLAPILCVGESLAERDAGRATEVVRRQVQAVVEHVGISGFGAGVVAYEPVWAIGTGRSATAAVAQEIHAAIRKSLGEADAALAERTRILYGGSVKAANAVELFAQADIDGALVGGAALDAEEFTAIGRAAINRQQ